MECVIDLIHGFSALLGRIYYLNLGFKSLFVRLLYDEFCMFVGRRC